MLKCPHCHQQINAQAIACPYCRTSLKAFGHPGIPLHRATGETYLCDHCTYHADDTCNFPQRPFAKECTLFQDQTQNSLELHSYSAAYGWQQQVRFWCQQHQAWLMLLSLGIVSFVVALLSISK
jgi:hypothetical protein